MRTALLVAPFVLIACGPPALNTPVAEIPRLAKLSEVMDNQATTMDPLFKKSGQPVFSDDDWAAFTTAASKIQATALKIKDFSKGPEFDMLAQRLHDQAVALGGTYATHDQETARATLRAMKATCKECHSKFR